MNQMAGNKIYEKLREKVFFYVTYQRRTEGEVRRNFLPLFKKNNIPREVYNDLIAELKDKGYIDDADFVRKRFVSLINFKQYSIKEMEHKILEKGIDKDLVEECKENIWEQLCEHEVKAAKILYDKKIKEKSEEDIKQYLRRKGFMESSIQQLNND